MRNKIALTFSLKVSRNDKKTIKVLIFPSRDDMYYFYQSQLEITGQTGLNDFEAMFQPWEIIKIKNGKEEKKHRIGNLLLYKDNLGSGLISHEMGHVCCHYWRINHPQDNPQAFSITSIGMEEDFLYPLRDLVAGFWRQYFKNEKIIKSLKPVQII